MNLQDLGGEEAIDWIADIFERRGAEAYLGEAVTMAEHMLQTAALARAEGAADTLVVAALLHDIGHLTGGLGEYTPEDTEDRRHDTEGASLLADLFPPAVAECVRLHVAAKCYLCATDPTYYGRLSEPSRHSLALQGGPMSEAELAGFRSLEFHQDAVQVRRWDDGGKALGVVTLTFDDFRPVLGRVVKRA